MSDATQPRRTSPRNRWALAVTIGVVSVVLGFVGMYVWALLGPKHTKTTTQTYDMDMSSLDVDVSTGNIDVAVTAAENVAVTRIQTWVGDEPPSVNEESTGDGLELVGHDCGFTFVPLPCETSYLVEIPANVAIVAHTQSGNITIDGEAASQQLSSTSGNITSVGNNAKTPITIEATSGNVKLEGGGSNVSVAVDSGNIELDDVAGDADIKTSSGNISGTNLTTPAMSVHSSSGSITLQFDEVRKVKADTGSGSIDLGFAVTPRSVAAKSGSGDVTFTVPGAHNYAVETSTGSGDERIDVATDPGADNTLELSTGSGDVAVKETE